MNFSRGRVGTFMIFLGDMYTNRPRASGGKHSGSRLSPCDIEDWTSQLLCVSCC